MRAAFVPQWWGVGDSLGDIILIEGRCGAPVHACSDTDELSEPVRFLGSAARRKHVVGQVIDVVPHPVVRIMKSLDMPPAALGRVRMSASTHINEIDRAIHSFVCVAMRFYVPLCRPAVTDNSSAGFDPVTKNSHQRAGGLSALELQISFPDSRSKPPNTHCPFTLCPLLYLRRPKLLSSTSTVFLGPKIF